MAGAAVESSAAKGRASTPRSTGNVTPRVRPDSAPRASSRNGLGSADSAPPGTEPTAAAVERRLTYSRNLADARRPWRWKPQPRTGATGGGSGAAGRAEVTTVRRIAEWSEPKSHAELQRFVLAITRFQHWIPDFASAAAPLVSITAREWVRPGERGGCWGPEQASAFHALRGAITGGPPSEALHASLTVAGSGGGGGGGDDGYGLSAPAMDSAADGVVALAAGTGGSRDEGTSSDGGWLGGSSGGSVEEELSRLAQWPEPTSTAKLQKFMSLTKRHAHWIKDYPTLAAPLTELLHVRWAASGKSDLWTADHAAAFRAVKAAPMQAAPAAMHRLAAWPEPETSEQVKAGTWEY